MADPLSIAASIIALVQATTTAVKFIGEVKDSSSECSRLLVELSMTSGILDSIRTLLEDDLKETWLVTARSLAKPQGPFQEYERLINTIVSKIRPATGLRKAGKAIAWPFKREEVKDMVAALERQKSIFVLALELDQAGLSTRMETKLVGLGLQIDQLQNEDQRNKAMELRRKVLDWLSKLTPQKIQGDVSERRQQGTGEWLFDCKEYLSWHSGNAKGGMIWCHGIPGAGKTSLVIDKLKLVRGPRTGIAFFYCDYRDMESHTTANIIASLLKQLCSSLEVLPQSVSRLYSESDMGQNTPKVEELRKVFLDVCRIFQDVYVIIDAVDECDGSKQRPTLLKTLDIIQKEAAKVFVTSRPYSDDIRRAFAQGPQIQINARTSDIRIYLEAKIHDNTAAEDIMDKRLMMEIVSVISEGASGMFLLPALQIQTILDETTRKGMKRALKIIPKSLESTFSETLKRLSRQSRSRSELGMSTLMWISHARRPLLIVELRQALAIDPEDETLDIENYTSLKHILECCLGLVIVHEESSTIRLVHYSVQEYLQKNKSEIFPDAERSIAQTCLAVLMFKDFATGKCNRLTLFDVRVRRFPFLLYAAQFWGDHARASAQNLLRKHVMRFTSLRWNVLSAEQALLAKDWYRDPSHPVRYASDWAMWFERVRENQNALHIVCQNGLSHLADELLRYERIDINSRNSHGQTPLWLATQNGFQETAQILLDAHADGDIPDVRYGDTPLILAIAVKNEAIVRALLDSGVDRDKTNSSALTPLLLAVDDEALALVEILMDYGASPNLVVDDTRTKNRVLVRAEKAGQIEIILTDYEMDVRRRRPSSIREENSSGLQRALDLGNLDILRAMIAHGAKGDPGQRSAYKTLLKEKEVSLGEMMPEMGVLEITPEPTGTALDASSERILEANNT